MLYKAPMVWGLLDLGFFVWYVGTSLWANSLPIYSDLRNAGETATSLGSLFLVTVAALATLLSFHSGVRDFPLTMSVSILKTLA